MCTASYISAIWLCKLSLAKLKLIFFVAAFWEVILRLALSLVADSAVLFYALSWPTDVWNTTVVHWTAQECGATLTQPQCCNRNYEICKEFRLYGSCHAVLRFLIHSIGRVVLEELRVAQIAILSVSSCNSEVRCLVRQPLCIRPPSSTICLTFWRRNYSLNFSTPVYKMWIIQEPNTLELWNKLNFEEREKKRTVYTTFKIFSTYICWISV